MTLRRSIMPMRWKTTVDHKRKDGYYKFTITIPDNAVPSEALKIHLLTSGNSRLAILNFARELIEKESYWYSCPDWGLDYGVER